MFNFVVTLQVNEYSNSPVLVRQINVFALHVNQTFSLKCLPVAR